MGLYQDYRDGQGRRFIDLVVSGGNLLSKRSLNTRIELDDIYSSCLHLELGAPRLIC